MDEFIKILQIRVKYFEEEMEILKSSKENFDEQIVEIYELFTPSLK